MTNDYYATNSLPLASYLSSIREVTFVGVDKTDINRIMFCYEPTGAAQEAADRFFANQALVNPQELFQNHRTLKDLVFEVRRNQGIPDRYM